MSDVRVNARSPYFIEANRVAPDPVVIPPPVEENTPPTVSITASNTNPCLTETVTLTAVATDTDGTIVSYLWGGTASPYTTSSITITNSVEESKTFYVIVTDDDGDTANASITIHWQDCTTQLPPQDIGVECGDTFNQATFSGSQSYNFIDVGNKIGNVTINLQDTIYSPNNVPVKFDITWNGSTVSTGYVGSDSFDNQLLTLGVSPSDINTSNPTNKGTGTSLTINKTAATPTEVTLTATTPLVNDSFTFELSCPDVLATTTYYYTLTGTCTTGTTEFTYLDVNGVTQTVTLAKDEIQLISAQENSVSVAVCTGTTEKGGESFDLGTPDLIVDPNAEFRIWLDNSGSMGDEINAIRNMIEYELKNSFLTYYDNDVKKYNQQVSSILDPISYTGTSRDDERFLLYAAQDKFNSTSTKVVNMIWVDEANSSYHVFTPVGDNTQTAIYLSDVQTLRNNLDAEANYGNKLVIIFCVEKTYNNEFKQFSHFIDNISNGVNGFEGSKGLSDRSDVIFVRNVEPSQTAAYYHQVTIDALTDLGYKI